jgi:DNA-binding MarR family transcriptional regulator
MPQSPVLMLKKKPNPSPELPIDAPERRRLPPLLRRAWYGLNQAFRRRIAHLGVTPDQFTVLRTLLENEGITQRRLTELMSSDPNTVASLLERMERAALVERQVHEADRRANCLRLSSLGQEKYEAARNIAVAMQTEILSTLPAESREPFLHHLDAVAEACRAAAENAPKTRH